MTIAIGFETVDGIVLGADRQMTVRGYHKFSQQKLFQDKTDSRALALVGANDLSLASEVWEKLLKYPTEDREETRNALETILNEMGRLYTDLPLELLLAISTKNSYGLFEFRGKGIQKVPFGVIGVGDSSLIRYLAKNTEMFWTGTDEALAIATYFLKRAEEFVDGCSGPMDVIELLTGPELVSVRPERIDAIDRQLAENQFKAFRNLFSLPSPT